MAMLAPNDPLEPADQSEQPPALVGLVAQRDGRQQQLVEAGAQQLAEPRRHRRLVPADHQAIDQRVAQAAVGLHRVAGGGEHAGVEGQAGRQHRC